MNSTSQSPLLPHIRSEMSHRSTVMSKIYFVKPAGEATLWCGLATSNVLQKARKNHPLPKAAVVEDSI